jgi:hypothetical protein
MTRQGWRALARAILAVDHRGRIDLSPLLPRHHMSQENVTFAVGWAALPARERRCDDVAPLLRVGVIRDEGQAACVDFG